MSRFRKVSRGSRSGKLRALMVVAPIALELVTQYRSRQKAKRGRLYRPSKREQMFDSLLNQANRYFGRQGNQRGRGRGFF